MVVASVAEGVMVITSVWVVSAPLTVTVDTSTFVETTVSGDELAVTVSRIVCVASAALVDDVVGLGPSTGTTEYLFPNRLSRKEVRPRGKASPQTMSAERVKSCLVAVLKRILSFKREGTL